MTSNIPPAVDRSDHHKHMDYVQDVITRLANNSFLTKGWALTLASALVGFAVTQKSAEIALAALVPAATFWLLDTYYLRLERAFRAMYNDIADKTLRDFKIDPQPYLANESWRRAGFSLSLKIFYLTVMVLTLAVAIILATTNAPATNDPNPSPVPSKSESPSEQSRSSTRQGEPRRSVAPTPPTTDTARPSAPSQPSASTVAPPDSPSRQGSLPIQP